MNIEDLSAKKASGKSVFNAKIMGKHLTDDIVTSEVEIYPYGKGDREHYLEEVHKQNARRVVEYLVPFVTHSVEDKDYTRRLISTLNVRDLVPREPRSAMWEPPRHIPTRKEHEIINALANLEEVLDKNDKVVQYQLTKLKEALNL